MVKLFSKYSNLCDHNPPTLQTDRQTDRRTDRQTTCDRNTALCTKVYRAVKNQLQMFNTIHSNEVFFCKNYNTRTTAYKRVLAQSLDQLLNSPICQLALSSRQIPAQNT